ncbi:cytochrome P450 [Trichocoleus sp. FACHB-591]|uniref:cytochrome P450 n=1 Tax=Trichocoleus sp. FACHB-591 TaxID=2692872 RepID=UPI001688C342|nr:cytochrome P450 [Trichocoleus sp. FACHB-591]MBD2099004.1 cytochrome P450 [Trichocoleus sp. FACHB-591]
MKLPDGPKGPKLFLTLQGVLWPLEFLEDCARRYGDPFTSRFASFPPFVVFSNPQAIQEIFTADPKLFDSGRSNNIFRPSLGDNSLILLDGDRHARQRRLLTPPFHGDRMRAYGQLICDAAEKVISDYSIRETVVARTAMQEVSLRVILRAVFGLDEGPRLEQLRQLLGALLEGFNSPLKSLIVFVPALQQDLGAWSPWGQFLRRRQKIDQLIYAEIEQRRAEPDATREDILSLMMAAQDEAGQPMTDVELRDELMTLLIAGHETTASSLSWALYWVHAMPEVHDRLLQELETVGPEADPSAIARLPYLNAVCQETLRLYPVVLFTFLRIAKAPVKIMGHEFEPGTYLSPCIYLTHHRPDLYPEPNQFRPERFLERQFSPYEYLPFGGGNRRCIGMAFAQYEMKLVLATLLSRWQFSLVDHRPVRPLRRGATFTPQGGIPLILQSDRPLNSLTNA